MFSKVNEFSTHPFTNLKPEYDYNRIEYEYNLETIGKFCILPYQLLPKSSIHGWGPRKGVSARDTILDLPLLWQ